MLELQSRYTSKQQFLTKVGTGLQRYFGANDKEAYMGDYPTLEELNDSLGNNTAQQWLCEQVADLSTFSGAKNLSGNQVDQVSRLIAQEYHDVKYSEMLLFFHRFKCGDYGKFYGSADPLDLMVALKEFMKTREEKLWKFREEKYAEKMEKEHEKERQKYVHWKQCQAALCTDQSPEAQKAFMELSYDSYGEEHKILLLWATQETYDAVEHKYIGHFSSVISKFYPGVTLKYRLYAKREQPRAISQPAPSSATIKIDAEELAKHKCMQPNI